MKNSKMRVKLSDGSFAACEGVRKMVLKVPQSAEAELHEKVLTLARETGRTYSAAMATVLGLDGELKARWVRETLKRPVRQ